MSSEKPLSAIKFFVCSTFLDLTAHRNAVIKKLQSHAGVINAQEFFGARDQKPLVTCLEEVDKSEVFIMFLGPRYGSIDPDANRSFVECEYERAKERNIPRFAYLIDDSHPFPIKYVSQGDDAERLLAFKELVKRELTVVPFTVPDDLAEKVYADLIRELPKKGFRLGEARAQEQSASASVVLQQFLVLPKLFHGRTVRIQAKLGRYSQANENTCRAFSYRYGAAIARKFIPLDEDLKSVIGQSLTEIFASEQDALALIEVPEGAGVDILLKTMQGEYSIESPIYGYENELGVLELAPYLSSRKRVVVSYHKESRLIRGLELVELEGVTG
jgi:hypothetical protein